MGRKNKRQRRKRRILVINPGSTSTKIAIFMNEKKIFSETLRHFPFELQRFDKIWKQYEFRKSLILDTLDKRKIETSSLDAVVGRGGLFKPLDGGTYRINQQMIQDVREEKYGEHASNLGCILAYGIAWEANIPAYVVDPPSVDEMSPLARYSGMPELPRESIVHALNIHAAARIAAKKLEKKYSNSRFVIAHLGGGTSITAVVAGKIIDCSHGLSGGPFTPERAGSLPVVELVELCYSGKYSFEEMKDKLVGKGGLIAYLGTNNAEEIEKRIKKGDEKANEVYRAMEYQISKEIGAMAAVLDFNFDAVVLTGGLAHSDMLTGWIKSSLSSLGKVIILPGEDELMALTLGALRVLRGEEEAKEY
jgi:butyrate kinase